MAAPKNKDEYLRLIESLNEKNRRLQKKVDTLNYQCVMQSKILNAGNLSTLQILFDQLITYINSHLKKIEIELNYMEHDAKDTVALFKFREYLMSVYTHLGSFLVLTEGLVHVELRQVQDKHSEIGNILDRLNGMPHDIMIEVLDEQERLYEHISKLIEEKEEGTL